jgi:uncharacterized protein (TIGR03435 family)
MVSAVRLIAVALGVAIALAGDAAAQQPTFEVASVKPNKSGPNSPQRGGLPPGDRVSLINLTARTLIQIAYPNALEIARAPAWIGGQGPNFDVERFDVVAKAEKISTAGELQSMLRTLLADRFKLLVHTESRTEPTWVLVLARRDGRLGPNLHPAAASCAALREEAQKPIEPGKDPCGMRSFATALMTGTMSVRGLTIDQIGMVTNDLERRRFVNKTGLTGTYDWDLRWTPQRFLQATFDRDRFPTIDPDGPSIFTALQEQLGLKLESEKGDAEILVIDRIEHPSEN